MWLVVFGMRNMVYHDDHTIEWLSTDCMMIGWLGASTGMFHVIWPDLCAVFGTIKVDR